MIAAQACLRLKVVPTRQRRQDARAYWGIMMRILSTLLAGITLAIAAPIAIAAPPAPLKITKPDAVRGVSQVVIGAFNVGFLFESVDKTAATGGMIGMFSGPTTAKSELEGVTPQMMQAIVDAAYADFRSQLEARGFTVADSATLFGSEAFAKVKLAPSPYEASVMLEKGSKGKTSFYKPSALPGLVMLPGDFMSTGLSGMGMQMQSGTTAYSMVNHAKASGQAVLDVVYLIDFSNVKRPGAFSFAGVRVNSGVSVVGDYSKLNLIAPSGKQATILMKQPVAVEGDFATIADSTGGVNKAMDVAGNVIGILGGVKTGKTRKYTFTAKPGAYEEGATKAATLANARLVDQLAALR